MEASPLSLRRRRLVAFLPSSLLPPTWEQSEEGSAFPPENRLARPLLHIDLHREDCGVVLGLSPG